MQLPKKNFVENDKYNHQANLPVLNWHHRNTNITTVEVLIVLYSDCVVNSESGFSNPGEHLICYQVCSLVCI